MKTVKELKEKFDLGNTSGWREAIDETAATLSLGDCPIALLKDTSYGWRNCPLGQVARDLEGIPLNNGLSRLSEMFTETVIEAWSWWKFGSVAGAERELNSALALLAAIDRIKGNYGQKQPKL